MTKQELAYTEIESLVTSFKNMPASQRKGLNEVQQGNLFDPNLHSAA